MARYRKKPVEIDAIEWTGKNAGLISLFLVAAKPADDFEVRFEDRGPDRVLVIPTLEGEMTASPGDFLICGVKGELYPCKPDVFKQTYESAEGHSDSAKLAALEAAGVDNWEGYGNAMAVLRGEAEEDY